MRTPRIGPFSFAHRPLGGLLALLAAFASPSVHAQNRVDLEDMNIKGELLNDNRLRMSSRDPQKMRDRVYYRTDFRKEITDSLEVTWPGKKAADKESP